jgi:hypothetical protein
MKLQHRPTIVDAEPPNAEHPGLWKLTYEDGHSWLVENWFVLKEYQMPEVSGGER